jgi:hypothetical protein
MSTALRQVFQRDFTGDMALHAILRGAPILLFPLSITHFIISMTTGKDMSIERKSLMTKTCSECLETVSWGLLMN